MKNKNNTKRSRTVMDISAEIRSGKQGEYNDNVYNIAKRPCNSADAFLSPRRPDIPKNVQRT